MKRILGLLWVALALVATPAVAQTFPKLTGRVVDDARILSPATVADLTNESEALERRTSDQLVVVTVRSTGGEDIQTYATQLGNRWGLGRKSLDNGVLIVVAPIQREVRIAVGYGLEGLLTGDRARVIVGHMLPYFSKGQYNAGLKLGDDEVAKILISDTRRPQRKPR